MQTMLTGVTDLIVGDNDVGASLRRNCIWFARGRSFAMVMVVMVVTAVFVFYVRGTDKQINGPRCEGWMGRVNQIRALVIVSVQPTFNRFGPSTVPEKPRPH